MTEPDQSARDQPRPRSLAPLRPLCGFIAPRMSAPDDPALLDHNATTPLPPRWSTRCSPTSASTSGNSVESASHGRCAREGVDRARAQWPALGCSPTKSSSPVGERYETLRDPRDPGAHNSRAPPRGHHCRRAQYCRYRSPRSTVVTSLPVIPTEASTPARWDGRGATTPRSSP